MAESHRVLIKEVETNRDDLKQLINQKVDFTFNGLFLSAHVGNYHTSRVVKLERLTNAFILTTQNTKYFMQLVDEQMTTEEHILANPVLRKITDELKQRPQAERTLAVADMQTAKGVAKYPETVNPSSNNLVGWLQHRFEEDFDGLVYTACALEVVEDMQHRFNEMQTALKLILDDTLTVSDYEETIQNVRLYANNGLHG